MTCTTRKRSVRTIGGVPRLVTPRLVEVTSRHFNCTTHAVINEFGPILQTKVRTAFTAVIGVIETCYICWALLTSPGIDTGRRNPRVPFQAGLDELANCPRFVWHSWFLNAPFMF